MPDISITSVWQAARLREKLTIIIGLAYVILPFDLIPEIILGPLGLLDDGGAILAIILTIGAIVRRQNSRKSNVIDGEEVRR